MLIRRAKINDFDKVYHLICQLEEKKFDKKKLKKLYFTNLANPDIYYLLAETSSGKKNSPGPAIAFMSVYVEHQLHHCGKVAEIMELIVEKEFRGEAIGSAFIFEAKKIALKNKCEVLEVATNRRRKKAHQFYKRKDFGKSHFKFTMNL